MPYGWVEEFRKRRGLIRRPERRFRQEAPAVRPPLPPVPEEYVPEVPIEEEVPSTTPAEVPLDESRKWLELERERVLKTQTIGLVDFGKGLASFVAGNILSAIKQKRPIREVISAPLVGLLSGRFEQRPPTAEEQARGIFAYQPTYPAEKAYEEWRPSGVTLPGTKDPVLNMLSGLIMAQPTEEGKTELNIKSLMELIPWLMIPGGTLKGGVPASVISSLQRGVQKLLLKEAKGEVLSATQKQLIGIAQDAEALISKSINEGTFTRQTFDVINKVVASNVKGIPKGGIAGVFNEMMAGEKGALGGGLWEQTPTELKVSKPLSKEIWQKLSPFEKNEAFRVRGIFLAKGQRQVWETIPENIRLELQQVTKTTEELRVGLQRAGTIPPEAAIPTKPAPVTPGVTKLTHELQGIHDANPMLFNNARKAATLDEFINKMSKGKPETVNTQVLTDFYNRVKSLAEVGMPIKPTGIAPELKPMPLKGVPPTKLPPAGKVIPSKGVPPAKLPPSILSKVETMWEGEARKVTGTFQEKAFDFWRTIEEKFTDKFAGINKITSRARILWKRTHPEEPFPIELDAELHAANLGGAADAGLQRAVDVFHKAETILGREIPISHLDSYLHLKHNLDVLAMHPARKVSGGLKGTGEVTQALKQLETQLGTASYAKLENAASEITNLYAQYLERGVKSGLVSRELADLLRSKYPNYNPIVYMFRVAEQAEGAGVGRAMSVSRNDIRALSEFGHKAARERPLNTLARFAIQKETLTRRNDAANAIVKLVKEDQSLQNQLKKLPLSQKGEIYYMANGERHSVIVPKWLEREAKLLGQMGLGDLEKFGQIVNYPSRAGMTIYNVAFFVPNLGADFLNAMMTYGIGPARVMKRLALNLKDIVSEDKLLAELRKSGGSISGFWGKTPEQIAQEATKKGQLVLRNNWDWKRVMGSPFELIGKIGRAVEMTPRSAVFELELKRGALLEQAGLAARRSTIDFQRSGTAIRQANALFLFLNAGIQGTLIPGRALRDMPRAKWFLAGFLAAVVGVYSWNRQFPEYEDVPDYVKYGGVPVMLPSKEYDKRGNKVPHYVLVIPNLREWAFFSGPLIYTLRKLDKQAPDDIGQFLEAWLPPLNPASQIIGTGGVPVPTQVGQTITELMFNRDTFRNRDIVSEEFQLLPPAEQYNEWTSITAREVGKHLGISPMKLDFFIRNVFGGLGTQILTATDRMLETVIKGDDNVRIQLLLDQLQSIQDNTTPDKIPARRTDFLESLSPTDRELVLRLEVHPESRIPILSDIMKRIYRAYGGQIYDTAKRQAKVALDGDTSREDARDEFNKLVLQNALNFANGLLGAQKYSELLSNYRLVYSGRTSESWRIRELAGAVAGEKVQPYLPEQYQWKAEERALNNYHQTIDRLFKELKGVETDENVSLIWRQIDNYVNSLAPEIKDYVNKHKTDWINDLPPEVQKVQRMREADLDYISQTGYWDIPTMEEQRAQGKKAVDLRSQLRQANPYLDANLAFWFDYITAVKTQQATDLLCGKANSIGRPYGAIPALAQAQGMGKIPITPSTSGSRWIEEFRTKRTQK